MQAISLRTFTLLQDHAYPIYSSSSATKIKQRLNLLQSEMKTAALRKVRVYRCTWLNQHGCALYVFAVKWKLIEEGKVHINSI